MANNPSDIDLMARIMVAENHTGSPDEYSAIANVMRNRMLSGSKEFGGNTIGQVLTARTASGKAFQFTPMGLWGTHQPNDPKDIDPSGAAYRSASSIASDVMNGVGKDPTKGGVYYYAPKTQKQLGDPTPFFAKDRKGMAIGQHSFYGPMGGNDLDEKDQSILSEFSGGSSSQQQPTQVASSAGQAPVASPQSTELTPHDEALLNEFSTPTQSQQKPEGERASGDQPVAEEPGWFADQARQTMQWAGNHPYQATALGVAGAIPLAMAAPEGAIAAAGAGLYGFGKSALKTYLYTKIAQEALTPQTETLLHTLINRF